jgi:hypothetical protein
MVDQLKKKAFNSVRFYLQSTKSNYVHLLQLLTDNNWKNSGFYSTYFNTLLVCIKQKRKKIQGMSKINIYITKTFKIQYNADKFASSHLSKISTNLPN